jgi:NAD(P)-dependent dehydrogenase (short-subunit alcohol dehydrogenase family)
MPDPSPVILVTGAAGNLGRAIATTLAARGARLALLDRAAAPLEELAAGLGGDHLLLPGVDLMQAEPCVAAVAEIGSRFGRLDGVAHTVGGFEMAPFADSDAAMFERMFRLNLLTTANLFRAALAPMRAAGRGSLVAVGAMSGVKAPAQQHAYAASKAGVLRLVESVAEEMKPQGIRANAVLPGTMDTPQNRAAMPDADPAAWVKPAEIAAVVAFLLFDAASGVTGTLLPVTGRG